MTIAGTDSVSRRSFVRGTSIAVAAAITGPFISRHGLASSGELNFMGWAGYEFEPAFAAFNKATGIKVNFIEQPDQDAFMAQARVGGAGAYDISEPTADRLTGWVQQEFVQPIDEAKAGIDRIEPAFTGGMAGSMQVIDGQRYGSPTIWGTEALCFDRDQAALEYGQASLGDLWDERFAGMVTVRPHSALAAVGRWLDAQGELPKPFIESYRDPDVMDELWTIALERALQAKASVAQFWKDENSAQGAFRANGCVIGLNWDTTAGALMKEGLPIGYVAPKEGAFAWMQNIVLFKAAKNVEQAYAFINFLNSPEGSVLWAKAYAANPTVMGAPEGMGEEAASFLAAAYPQDALEKLWYWPVQPTWFIAKRNEYADKFQAG